MKILLFLLISFVSINSFGQVLTFDFAGITGSEPSVNSNFNNAGVTSSTITRGAGLTASANADRFNATNWALTSIANAISTNNYMQFTITPNAGCDFSISSIVIQLQRSATGPTQVALRSSADAYSANLGAVGVITDNTTTQTFTFTFTQSNINIATTYRFYMYAEAAGGSGGIGDGAGNDIIVNGTTACTSNTISTSNVIGGPFTVDCSTTDLGTVDFTSTGTYNVGNIFTAQLSNSAGSFASPINVGTLSGAAAEGSNPGGTINFTIPAGTATGVGYRIRVISSNPATIGTNNGSDFSITNNPCSITPGAITGAPFSVDCSTPASGSIPFTSIGTYLVGNEFTVQLSNSSGSFASPISLQSFIGSSAEGIDPSGTINISIPAETPTGAGYLIRIVSSLPTITSSSTSVFTITLTGGPCVLEPPHLTSVIINSCDGLCTEGNNEIVFGNSGDYTFDVNTTNFNFLYGATAPGTNYTDILVSNATRINELNTAAGCGGLFVDANGANIPANASWMLVSTAICEEALTWSGLCGSGPIYVIFQNDPNWQTSGNFANNPAAPGIRYYQTSITTTLGSTFTIDYTTNGSYPNSDGVYATFDSDGGPAPTYGDNNCILTPVVLPTGLLNFSGSYLNSVSNLSWQAASEQNNSHFTLSHSVDGYQFNVIGTVMGAGNSSELKDYRFIHNYPHPGMNYYKLKSTDYDGKEYFKGIVALEAEFNFSFYNSLTETIELSYESDVEIFSMDGKLIQGALNTSSVPFTKSGMFFIYDKKTGISERLFVP